MKHLYDTLMEYGKNGNYALHMPGHKRQGQLLQGMDAFAVDITEIEGFDNLHYAEGILKDAMEQAAKMYATDRTWFLVNGSSCGILASISAVTDIGDHIIIGRNCHKSVYHAAMIRNLQVDYLYPAYMESHDAYGGYDPAVLDNMLRAHSDVKAVVLTSPTYEGFASDIKTLAEVAHSHGAFLIVDEAHGAHFAVGELLPQPMDDVDFARVSAQPVDNRDFTVQRLLPQPAYRCGADLVIESLHKTLPSLTQTAILHYCDTAGSWKTVDDLSDKVEQYLGIYQSSSPSYLFLASIDRCIRELFETGAERMERLWHVNRELRETARTWKYIDVPDMGSWPEETRRAYHMAGVDFTKVLIYVNREKCDGNSLAEILRTQYHFEVEMAAERYVLAMTTICDDEKEIRRLKDSLEELDRQWQEKDKERECYSEKKVTTLESECSERKRRNVLELECSDRERENVLEIECSGREKKVVPINDCAVWEVQPERVCTMYAAERAAQVSVKLEECAGKVSGEFVYLYPPGIPVLVPGEKISPAVQQQMLAWRQAERNLQGLRDKENRSIWIVEEESI